MRDKQANGTEESTETYSNFNDIWKTEISWKKIPCRKTSFRSLMISDQWYQLQHQVNNISVKFSHRLYKIACKTIIRSSIKSLSLTSPKAPRPITFNISKSSLCNRICFTLEVNGLAETKRQHQLLNELWYKLDINNDISYLNNKNENKD